MCSGEVEISDRWSKIYIPKNLYKTVGSKTYTPKNLYTKTTYSPLLSEKLEGSVAPSCPIEVAPMNMWIISLGKVS
ncbi:hypothetical protein Hanom_Chr11g00985221 [Helianthus anomalus]